MASWCGSTRSFCKNRKFKVGGGVVRKMAIETQFRREYTNSGMGECEVRDSARAQSKGTFAFVCVCGVAFWVMSSCCAQGLLFLGFCAQGLLLVVLGNICGIEIKPKGRHLTQHYLAPTSIWVD